MTLRQVYRRINAFNRDAQDMKVNGVELFIRPNTEVSYYCPINYADAQGYIMDHYDTDTAAAILSSDAFSLQAGPVVIDGRATELRDGEFHPVGGWAILVLDFLPRH